MSSDGKIAPLGNLVRLFLIFQSTSYSQTAPSIFKKKVRFLMAYEFVFNLKNPHFDANIGGGGNIWKKIEKKPRG